MKKLIIAAAVAATISTPVLADKYNYGTSGGTVVGTVVQVTPDTRTIKVQVPDMRCEMVDVPIYGGGRHASPFDKLGGAIIGGVVGNQFGGGSGKDALTVLGAIAGADIANKRMSSGGHIVGYRQKHRCTTAYTTELQERTYGYNIVVEVEDTVINARTTNRYRVGDKIEVRKQYDF